MTISAPDGLPTRADLTMTAADVDSAEDVS